jgi:3-hydroxyacyl-[acyl-carrier-protein] dehydratase
MWYKLNHLEKSDSGQIVAEIQAPPDSPWFSGHFPGQPILPGIAQLGMVFDAICHFGSQNMKISHISRVRFKQMIRPNDSLRIIVMPQKDHAESYSFRIMIDKELACSGLMKVE